MSIIETLSKLEETGLTTEQARTIAGIIEDQQANQATKKDVKELEMIFQKDMKELEMIFQKDMKELEMTLQKDMKELEVTFQKDMKELEMTFQKDMKELELRLTDKMNSHLRWVAGFLVGQTALLFVLIKFLGS